MPRGGKREGAGRPAPYGERKRGRSVALTAAVWAYVEAGDKSANEQIEAIVRRSPGFKAWAKSNVEE